MAQINNFLAMYGRLGLDADCSEAELRQAYRRYIADRHPDRQRERPAMELAEVQQVTAMFAAAMAFYRERGHLPGSAPARATPPPAPASSRRRGKKKAHGLLLVTLVAAGLLLWHAWPAPTETGMPAASPPPSTPSPRKDGADGRATPESFIDAGSTRREVLDLAGQPQLDAGDRWDYGPSWVRFRDDRVVDWYSSPLRPLPVRSTSTP